MSILSNYTKFITQLLMLVVLKYFILPQKRPARSISPFPLNDKPHIVVSNHRQGIDPCALLASLTYRDFFHLAPFAAMTANRFYDPWWIRVPAWLAGCFPAHGPKGRYGVEGAVYYLSKNYTLLMFPEGKRIPSGRGPAKHGISDILAQSPDAKLILYHIEWSGKRQVKFINTSYPDSFPKDAESIMQRVYDL